MSVHSLRNELRQALVEVRLQEQNARETCIEDGLDPLKARNHHGEFVLAPYISAKTQLLCALASLEKS